MMKRSDFSRVDQIYPVYQVVESSNSITEQNIQL